MDLFKWLDSVQQSLQLVRQPGGRWVARVYGFQRRGADPGFGTGLIPEVAVTDFLVRSCGRELFAGDSDVRVEMPMDVAYRAKWSV